MSLNIPLLDIPIDMIAGDDVTGQLLNEYGLFPCRIKACVFALCVRGEVHTKYNLGVMHIKAGDLIVMLPDTFMQIQSVSSDTLIYFVGFSYNFYSKTLALRLELDFIRRLLERPIFSLPADLFAFYEQAFKTLVGACQIQSISVGADIKTNILQLLFQSVSNITKQTLVATSEQGGREQLLYKEFMHAVLAHYRNEHGVSYYASLLGVTLPHLCSTIKHVSQKTALQIINEAIVLDAQAQLRSTSKQIKEIALELGFENVSFFAKFFKKHTGLTPKQYREE